MTGRRENPLPTTGKLRLLAARLREIRDAAATTYREMENTANYTASALSQAASGVKYPTWDCVQAYLKACQAADDDQVVNGVRALWTAADQERKTLKARRGSGPRLLMDPAPLAGQLSVPEPVLPEDALPVDVPDRRTDPRYFTDFKELVQGLKLVREKARLSLKDVIEISAENASRNASSDGVWLGETISLKKTTAYDVFSGKARPSEAFVIAFVYACGQTYDEVHAWGRAHRMLLEQERRAVRALKALTGTTLQAAGVELPEVKQIAGVVQNEEIDQLDSPRPPWWITVYPGLSEKSPRPVRMASRKRRKSRTSATKHRRAAIALKRANYTIEISEEAVIFLLVVAAVLLFSILILFWMFPKP